MLTDRTAAYRSLLNDYKSYLHPNGQRLLYTDGDIFRAKYFIIGESAGDVEVATGLAFQGPSGQELTRMLKEAGIERHECYLTNLAKLQPFSPDGKQKNDFSFVDKELLSSIFLPMLRREISIFSGNIIILLGAAPLYYITGNAKIGNWRGSVIRTVPENIKCLPTYHPAAVNRNWKFRQVVVADLRRAKRESTSTEIKDYEYKYLIHPTCDQVLEYLDRAEKECTWGEDRVNDVIALVIDVETKIGGRINVRGFGWLPDEAMSVSFINADYSPYWTINEEMIILRKFAKIYGNPEIPKIAHNVMFDFFQEAWEGMPVRGLYMDTMQAHHCLHSELPHTLQFLTSIYTNMPYYKEEGHEWKPKDGLDQYLIYNCKDILGPAQIYPRLRAELQSATYPEEDGLRDLFAAQGLYSLWDFYVKFYNGTTYTCLKTSLRGTRINTDIYNRERNRIIAEIKVIQEKVDHALGYHLNTNASSQLIDCLYNDLGFPIQFSKGKKGKERKPTADKNARRHLQLKFRHPIISAIDALKKKRTLIQNFFIGCTCEQTPCICEKKPKYDSDIRMRCTYNNAGTKTGRRSSSECPLQSGCLLPEAEVLTSNGWVSFENLTEGTKVAQWNWRDGSIKFIEPLEIIKLPFKGSMITADSWTHKNVFTPDHRVPSCSHRKSVLSLTEAQDIRNLPIIYIPISGSLLDNVTLQVSPILMRIIAMVQADGSVEGNNIRLAFKKERKIERFKHLMMLAQFDYTEQKASQDFRRFCISTKHAKTIIDLIGKEKRYGKWLLEIPVISLAAFINEIGFWDAHKRGDSYVYYTVVKENAEWVSTIAHLTGNSATMRVDNDNNSGYGQGNNLPLWSVNVKPRVFATVQSKHWGESDYEGFVYCIKSTTGFFLVRYNNVISISCNCNLQNIPKSAREMFIADPGKLFLSIDEVQAEAVCVAYEADDRAMINMYEHGWIYTPTECFPAARSLSDLHSKLASIGLNIPVEEISEKDRNKYKRGMHASNYLQTSSSFAIDQDLSFEEAERIYRTKNMMFPDLSVWQTSTAKTAQLSRRLFNPLGRRRTFFDRPSNEMAREAVAQVPQSTVNDVLKIAQMRIDLLGYDIMLEVHDALVLQISCDQLEDAIKDVWDAFNIPLVGMHSRKTYVIPVDMEIGFSWGVMEKLPTELIPLTTKAKARKTVWDAKYVPIGYVEKVDVDKKEVRIHFADYSTQTFPEVEITQNGWLVSKK